MVYAAPTSSASSGCTSILIVTGPRHFRFSITPPTHTMTVEPPNFFSPVAPFDFLAGPGAGAVWPPRLPLAGISQAEIQAEIRSHPGAPTPAPPVRALAPAPYRTQGARRAQATQTAHLTGPQRLQPPPGTPCLPNVPNPWKKRTFSRP